jgi:uncharacterized membrane protein
MSADLGARPPEPDDVECPAGSRAWILPVAVVAAVVTTLVALVVLEWSGLVPGPAWSGPYPPLWPIFPLGFLAFWLVVAFVVRPWGWWGYRGGRGYEPADPESVVRIRYARGEISRDQLAAMLRDLRDSGSRAGGGRLR